ncbi:MAG: hypothetical protein KF771_03965 [Burkholderiales bacterium]|nr:hypothetical protein [Burkholderiales bacterium]
MVLLSSPGEPLRAEIEVSAPYHKSEIPVLQLASAEAYARAGLQYDAVLDAARLRFDLRADGRPYYALQSARPLAASQVALLVERVAPGPLSQRAYVLQIGGTADRGAVFAPVEPRKPAVPRVAATADDARWLREVERLQVQVDAQGRALAGMLERVAAMESAVAALQRGLEARSSAAAAAPSPAPVAEKPPVPAPAPAAALPPAVSERTERQALSASWVNHSLLLLAAGVLVLLLGIGGWMLWGPLSRDVKAPAAQ